MFFSARCYNEIMNKLFGGILALLIALSCAPVASAGINDFTISNFDIQYSLGRDGDRRSTLETTETITAEFPDSDQNHGLERMIPTQYNGHSVSLEIDSVTDEGGNSLEYSIKEGNENKVLRIGSADTYVHGTKTYVITYKQYDVTRLYSNTAQMEWYWDTNGTQWYVPIDKLNITVQVDSAIADKLTGDKACYQGFADSTEQCSFEVFDKGQFSASATNLEPGENVSLAIGFEKSTFGDYEMTLWEIIWVGIIYANMILFAVAIAVAIWLAVRFNRIKNRTREMGTIVPEYLPPPQASVLTSARVDEVRRSAMTAQLIDLAVCHYIKIHEIKKKTAFTPAEYELEITSNIADLRWEEQELLRDTFGSTGTEVGTRFNLKALRKSTGYGHMIYNNTKVLDRIIRKEYNLRYKDEAGRDSFRRIGTRLMIIGALTLSVGLLTVGIAAFISSYFLWSLTDEGLALKRYLKGLKLYISVAEEERLRMLQGPETAEKVAFVADGTEVSQLVKLYERVLPYAILFNQEKQWNKQLGQYYEVSGQQPNWYAGNSNAFNAVAFATAMSSFSSGNSYILSSSSSSSTGGSGGGGFSGGGGGGGGGGGW